MGNNRQQVNNMINFWQLSNGETPEAKGEFDAGGGGKPIPNDTGCIAAIEDPKWDSYEGENYISIRWRVSAPAPYANRVVFQKIYVEGKSSAKNPEEYRDKAVKMLIAIDANAGGGLYQLQRAPTNDDLMRHLAGKLMAIKVMLWEMNGKTGNWVGAVAPPKSSASKAAPNPMQQKAAPPPPPPPAASGDYDDSIPF